MIDDLYRTCGRPTRSGSPCRIRISGSDVACGTHATEHDKEIAEAHRRGWREGWDSGHENATYLSRAEVERLERRVVALEQQLGEVRRERAVADGHVVRREPASGE